MLKFLFICLLIADAVLFGLWRGYITNPILEPHQPERLLQQKNSDRLKLISAEVATAPPPVLKVPEPPKVETLACLEWGSFQAVDLVKVDAKLKALSFGSRQSRLNAQEIASTMVFIPPLGSKEAADKKASELLHLGVRDFFIIQDQSNLRWGISLGVFKSEEAAKQLLATLVSKGVRSARIGARSAATNKFNYIFKNVSSVERVGLEKLKADFPAQDLHLCK